MLAFFSNLSERMKGKSCQICISAGVRCTTSTGWNDVPANTGEVVIYHNDNPVLRTTEPISGCPVVLGTTTIEALAAQTLKNTRTANINALLNHKPGNY